MADLNGIHFASAGQRPLATDSTWVAVVPAGIADTDELLQHVARVLSFPAWFGGTFNGLYDGLCDLVGITAPQVVLVHEDVPTIPDEDLDDYLETLRAAATDARGAPGTPRLAIYFDKAAEPALRKRLASG